MNISNLKQIYFSTFTKDEVKKEICEKYELQVYNDVNKPTIFLGCNYEKDRNIIRNHNSIGYIFWYDFQLNGKNKSKNIRNNNFLNEIKNKLNLINYKITSYTDFNINFLFEEKQEIIKNEDKKYYNYDCSIVMAYYNRKNQLLETLKEFQKLYSGKYNFEVIIVDDASKEENKIDDIIKDYSFLIKLIKISEKEKGERVNPCITYNRGFEHASGRIVLIQNSECFHVGNILGYTLDNLTENDYFAFSCFNTNNFDSNKKLLESSNKLNLIKEKKFLDSNIDYQKRNIKVPWYNHPTFRPCAYNFCSAIYKSKLDIMGGFDERFAEGYGFDDDQFLLLIKYKLNLNIKIIPPDNLFVIHQYHERKKFELLKSKKSHPLYKKWLKNKKLFETIEKEILQSK